MADGSRATSDAALLCMGDTMVDVGVAGMIVTDETMLGMFMADTGTAAGAVGTGDMTSL